MGISSTKNPLISVIIPAYNTEKYLNHCLESLARQTYPHLEFIIVDDGSIDQTPELVRIRMRQDSRFRLVSHPRNLGLFRARLTGVEQASGEYISFVDSDDYVTIDWFRILVETARSTGSDIVMGNTIMEDETGKRTVPASFYSFCRERHPLHGNEILNLLLENEGLYFFAHTIWNKLYHRDLWTRSQSDLSQLDEHLVMTEDILFSFVLFYHAQKMAFSDHEGYVYRRYDGASTGAQDNYPKINKNVQDLCKVFAYIEDFLLKRRQDSMAQDSLQKWKATYFRIWSHAVKDFTEVGAASLEEKRQLEETFFKGFDRKEYAFTTSADHFFLRNTLPWDDSYEAILEEICDREVRWVSFDIFDTLIVRPFWEPSDLFVLMQEEFERLTGSIASFPELRQTAESRGREEEALRDPSRQDIQLVDIYSAMGRYYHIGPEICDALLKMEIQLEQKYCHRRESAAHLYQLAVELGKEIILVSDMYLPMETIVNILKDNGYTQHSRIFLSSEDKKLKRTGDLYSLELEALRPKNKNEVLHIGNDIQLDVEIPRGLGMRAAHFPNSTECLAKIHPNLHATCSGFMDLSHRKEDFSLRCVYALAAGILFDNPFRSVYSSPCYQGDPYVMGVLPLGMHLLGLGKWLVDICDENGIPCICFTARDGFLPYKTFGLLQDAISCPPEMRYLYISRKALAPARIQVETDFYEIKGWVGLSSMTPRKILENYRTILRDTAAEQEDAYRMAGVALDEHFTDTAGFDHFIDILLEVSYDPVKLAEYRELAAFYLKTEIPTGALVFDTGYSGRIQQAIHRVSDIYFNTAFVHTKSNMAHRRIAHIGSLYCYYNFHPAMSGIVYEYFTSGTSGSCIGYSMLDGIVRPELEQGSIPYTERWIHTCLEAGSVQLMKRFAKVFGPDVDRFSFHSNEISGDFEQFLLRPTPLDLDLFTGIQIEDNFFNGESLPTLNKFWTRQSAVFQQQGSMNPQANSLFTDLYEDGLFVAFYNWINRKFPKGGWARDFIKSVAHLFIH